MKTRLMLALAPAALALATAAAAQQPPQDGHGPMHGMPAEMKAMHEAMMKQHIEDLKTVLRLRPDQEPALQAFLDAHKPPEMGDMHGMHEMHDGMAAPKSTPEQLDEMAKHEAAMAAQHEKMRKALGTFYAALTPEQQKVFDALQRLEHGPMGGHHMGMGHMGPMGMDGGPRIKIMRHMEGGPPPPPGDEP